MADGRSTDYPLSLSLANDRRLRQHGSTQYKEAVTTSDVIISYIRDNVSPQVPASTRAMLSDWTPPHQYLARTPHGVCLADYGERLRTDKRYLLISGKFIDALPPTVCVEATECKYRHMMKTYFHPEGLRDCSDDRIMMMLIVTADIFSYSLQTLPVEKCCSFIGWLTDILTNGCSPEDAMHTVERFNSWLVKYDILTTMGRKCDIISDEELIAEEPSALPLTQSSAVSRESEDTTRCVGVTGDRVHSDSVECPQSTDQTAEDLDLDPHNLCAGYENLLTPDVVLSYIADRNGVIQKGRVSNRRRKELLENERLRVVMREYGNVITQREEYRQLMHDILSILSMSTDNQSQFSQLLYKYVLPKEGGLLFYDQIMTVILIANDLVSNALASNDRNLATKYIAACQRVLLGNPRWIPIIEAGWVEMPDLEIELVNKRRFHILDDQLAIGQSKNTQQACYMNSQRKPMVLSPIETTSVKEAPANPPCSQKVQPAKENNATDYLASQTDMVRAGYGYPAEFTRSPNPMITSGINHAQLTSAADDNPTPCDRKTTINPRLEQAVNEKPVLTRSPKLAPMFSTGTNNRMHLEEENKKPCSCICKPQASVDRESRLPIPPSPVAPDPPSELEWEKENNSSSLSEVPCSLPRCDGRQEIKKTRNCRGGDDSEENDLLMFLQALTNEIDAVSPKRKQDGRLPCQYHVLPYDMMRHQNRQMHPGGWSSDDLDMLDYLKKLPEEFRCTEES